MILNRQSSITTTRSFSHHNLLRTHPNGHSTDLQGHPFPSYISLGRPLKSALKSTKGFGAVTKQGSKNKAKKRKEAPKKPYNDEEEEEEEDYDGEKEDVIPEIVTNRMIKRIGISVGLPIATAFVFFPAYYYMKKFLKWGVPDWLPIFTSAIAFGAAAFGITYGIVSTSWDPLREGSALGWNEAQRNWPVFLDSIRNRGWEWNCSPDARGWAL